MEALILVDLQNDFLPGGAWPYPTAMKSWTLPPGWRFSSLWWSPRRTGIRRTTRALPTIIRAGVPVMSSNWQGLGKSFGHATASRKRPVRNFPQ